MTRLHALLTAAVVAAAGPQFVAAAEYSWKCQSFWQPGTVNQKAFEQFAADVNEKSGGRIEIEPLAVNTIVAPGEMLDAMNAGLLDCMNSGVGYFVTKDPAFGLVADLNAGYENPEQVEAWLREGGGIELAREIVQRVQRLLSRPGDVGR